MQCDISECLVHEERVVFPLDRSLVRGVLRDKGSLEVERIERAGRKGLGWLLAIKPRRVGRSLSARHVIFGLGNPSIALSLSFCVDYYGDSYALCNVLMHLQGLLMHQSKVIHVESRPRVIHHR